MSKVDNKVVFGVGAIGPGDSIVLLGVPRAAWEYMKDGKTHHFDLAAIGLPVKIMLYGAETHDAAVKVIEEFNARQGKATLDLRREDFSIKPDTSPIATSETETECWPRTV